MPWYTGKTKLAVACCGDSNAFCLGLSDDGGQEANPNLYHYATASGVAPFVKANLGWRTLDPQGASRILEAFDAMNLSFVGPIPRPEEGPGVYFGQMLGNSGNSATKMTDMLQRESGIDSYLVQSTCGGTTADFWANDTGWDEMLDVFPAALAAMPGSPTAFDVIFLSMGGNDSWQGVTAQDSYDAVRELRRKMIEQGWWVPGVTQIVLQDLPNTQGYIDLGGDLNYPMHDWVLSRFNDRIAGTSNIGFLAGPDNLHWRSIDYTNAGRQAGGKVIAQIPRQRSTVSVGGSRVSINGSRLRVLGAA